MSISDDPLILAIKARINSRIETEARIVTEGKCSTLEDYKRRTGMITGFYESLANIDDVVKNFGHEIDDDEKD
jgi:hypothetical protein